MKEKMDTNSINSSITTDEVSNETKNCAFKVIGNLQKSEHNVWNDTCLVGWEFLVQEKEKINIQQVNYKDLINIRCVENNEPFMLLNKTKILCFNKVVKFWDELYSPWNIFVRKWVCEKLLEVNQILKTQNYEICVVYWYRGLQEQTKKFLEILKTKTDKYYENPLDLYEEIHKFIAVPNVAWHPTWWAVDVLIYDNKNQKYLDFWTKIYDFETEWWNSIF